MRKTTQTECMGGSHPQPPCPQVWRPAIGDGGQGLVIDESDGHTVAVAHDGADAPLLAAAPALRDSLEALLLLQDREDVADEWSPKFREARLALEAANSTSNKKG